MENIQVLDFGGPSALIAARKLRSMQVFSQVVEAVDIREFSPHAETKGIVIAGGEGESDEVWQTLTEKLLTSGVPILAMGAGALRMFTLLGGKVCERKLYHQAALARFPEDELYSGAAASERFFIESYHLETGENWCEEGAVADGTIVAFRHSTLPLYGMQFSVESNDPDGWTILNNFAKTVCGCGELWKLEAFCESTIEKLSKTEGETLIAVSGGVDSAVSAELMRRAVGDRLHCIFVNTGLMRKGEVDNVRDMFRNRMHMNLEVVDAQERIWTALRGITQPAKKRYTIHRTLKEILLEKADEIGGVDNLVRGIVYTDVLAARSGYGVRDKRVETVAEQGRHFKNEIEPLADLFKGEVRQLAKILNMPEEQINRQPFPSLGLARRIMGEVTVERINLLREADAILTEEISSAGLDKKLYQYFCVLTDLNTPGTKDGHAVAQSVVAIRAVSSQDALSAYPMRLPYDVLERVVTRVVELPCVNRVVYDITPTPEADIEWV